MKHIGVFVAACFLLLSFAGCKIVSGGDYTLYSGETLSSDLNVSGGHATLQKGSRVMGSLTVTGGSTDADGEIMGSVSQTGGDIAFGPNAVVRGVINKTGGSYTVAPGAQIHAGANVDVGNIGQAARTVGTVARSLVTAFSIVALLLIVVFVITTTQRTSRPATQPQSIVKAAEQPASDTSIPSAPTGDTVPPPPAPASLSNAPTSARGLGGNIVLGVILLAVGILFLLQETLNVNVFDLAWPFVVIVIGLLCFGAMLMQGSAGGRFAMPGSILTMAGLILLYQNTFDRYESWAYAWALIFPTAIGIGHWIEGRWSSRPALSDKGVRETETGLILFIVLAAFFELVINLGGFVSGDIARFAFPALLIGLGILLLISWFIHWPGKRQPPV